MGSRELGNTYIHFQPQACTRGSLRKEKKQRARQWKRKKIKNENCVQLQGGAISNETGKPTFRQVVSCKTWARRQIINYQDGGADADTDRQTGGLRRTRPLTASQTNVSVRFLGLDMALRHRQQAVRNGNRAQGLAGGGAY